MNKKYIPIFKRKIYHLMKNTFTLVFLFSLIFTINAQTDIEKVMATVFKNDIQGHIYFLASDELRGRMTGTPEIDIAAAYLANNLRRFGVQYAGENTSFYQTVLLEKKTSAKHINIELNKFTTKNLIQLKAVNTNFEGEIIYLSHGLENDYKNKDVKGKLILVKAGNLEKNDTRTSYGLGKKKRELAMQHGASGLIELSKADENSWKNLTRYFNGDKTGLVDQKNDDLLHLWLQDSDGAIENEFSSAKKIDGKLTISGIEKKLFSSKNVVGMLEGTDPKLKDEFVIYSAHYDHMGVGKPNAENDSIFNGARDNAVGMVTVLSAAENIAKYPTKRSSLFILFTGEEMGLLGSSWYVENPLIPLEKMVYCFNSDNAGYNDTSKATIIGLNRTTESNNIINAAKAFGLTAVDDPAPEQGLFDRSDNVNFAAKGIPAPCYSMGLTAFNEDINKYYHQVTDNPDTLDYDYLVKFFRSYVLACRLISNKEETPYWTEGDKYYEAGEKLYNR